MKAIPTGVPIFAIVLLAFPIWLNAQEPSIVPTGAGSYLVGLPAGCEGLPAKIYRSGTVHGSTPTNQWWSSLVWERHSQNMFPHPLGMVCCDEGLAISYPGAAIVGSSGNIMGGGVSSIGDLVIGLADMPKFSETNLLGCSDWFVNSEFLGETSQLQTTFGHGSPFVYCRALTSRPMVRFAEKPRTWSALDREAIGITVRGNHYGLFGARGSRWKFIEETSVENLTDKEYFSVALLPDDHPDTLKLFAKYAHNHVVDTRVDFQVLDGQLKTTYRFITQAMEGSEKGTLFALYPHQWKYTQTELLDRNYRSVRGIMKLARGDVMTTSVPIQGVLPTLPREGIADRRRMLEYLTQETSEAPLTYGDTYWEGKRLGKLATLSGIAELLEAEELQVRFLGEIRTRLENWLTASPGEQSPLFYYDSNWGTLIGSKPSYGSDSQLNDHHFHYGYFIRAAAELARHDPDWGKKWAPMINLLVRDIACGNIDDSMFPRLRCFDLYAGHSWASGHSKFGDGNNQESSSESMNAWYALMLWGEVSGDSELRDLGIFLYNTERTAVEEYWFDVSGTNFPENFPNVALGMIWGGKGAFATWFSGEIDHIHGINWLPFTPASIYMGRFPKYVEKNHDRLMAKRSGGSDYNQGWGDLIAMFGALNDPAPAMKFLESTPQCKVEDGNSRAFMYHWVNTLGKLGRNDPTITADHPFVNVFRKGDLRTYVVYNFGDSPITVHFSDGTQIEAAPKSQTLQHSK